jgi:hypothetical protein
MFLAESRIRQGLRRVPIEAGFFALSNARPLV